MTYGVIKFRQIFRRNSEVGVQYHQYLTGGLIKTQSHGIAFTFSCLLKGLDIFIGIFLYYPFNFFICPVP